MKHTCLTITIVIGLFFTDIAAGQDTLAFTLNEVITIAQEQSPEVDCRDTGH
jgi:hypothetical protein